MNQKVTSPSHGSSSKKLFYRIWKHLDKKKYVSLFGYKIHAYLSEKLKKQGIISSSSNLKLKRYRYLYETLFPSEPHLPPFILKATFELFYKKFFCLQLRANTIETLAVGSSHGWYGYVADDA